MKSNRNKILVLASLLVALGCGQLLWADPPDRVGRISLLSGTVSFHPASVDEWTPATLNYPLTTGDNLWTDQDGEAEIHVGSTAIRLAASTEFSFLNLDDQTTQIRVSTGSLNLRLRHLDPGEVVEVDTPNSSLSLTRTGSYRVDVQETGDTSITVRAGEAEVTAGDSSFSVFPNQAADITGIDSPSYQVSMADPPDDWDQWCQGRDVREDQMVSTHYVPREMIGVEDLDGNGTWRVMPGYGAVWQPNVMAGWAPYHYGHWAWVDPWGWTWVDDAPWGFAPFHYGRWAFLGAAWVWVPGAVVARPVYAPALVVFVGGNGWGSSAVAGGGVGWFPLGPREPYVPPYTVSNVYVRNINISHVTVVNVQTINVVNYRYVNRGVPGAMTAVPNQAFVRAQPVQASAFIVPRNDTLRAPVRGGYAPLAPVRESILGRPMVGPAARPPEAVWNRPVVVRTAPPPPPVSFADRQRAMDAHPGRPLDPGTVSTLRRQSPGPNPPPVIVRPPQRGPGNQPQKFQQGQNQQPQYQQPQGQQPAPRMQPGNAPQGQIQQGQPAPRMQPGNAPQPNQPAPRNPQNVQQGPRVQQGVQQGGQQGVQQGQPAPRMQPGVRRGPQGQAVPPGQQKPEVKTQGQPGGKPASPNSNDDLLKKKKPQDQGGQGQPGGPGGN
ncbi:MAG: DUF6600 domain-containing protein [Spirochaetia bacterium]|jgi:hypothetical protein